MTKPLPKESNLWMTFRLYEDGTVTYAIPEGKDDFTLEARALAKIVDKLRAFIDDWEMQVMGDDSRDEEEVVH